MEAIFGLFIVVLLIAILAPEPSTKDHWTDYEADPDYPNGSDL